MFIGSKDHQCKIGECVFGRNFRDGFGYHKWAHCFHLMLADLTAEKTLDGKGDYALPGLIDTHVHIDSTLLTPEHLAEVIVPHGTTSMFVDPMEISNVAGMHGYEH